MMMWDTDNRSVVQEFILEGFPAVQHLGKILFLVHLLAYLASIMGNTLIITITWADQRLHTPMYFFLSTFSFVECCFITTVIPKLLAIFLSGRQAISFAACFTQAFVFLSLESTVFFLMGVLSLDRYLAICRPLRYSSIMSPRWLWEKTLVCWKEKEAQDCRSTVSRQLFLDQRGMEILMEVRNETTVQEFILEGFPAVQHLGKVLFLVHLLAYLASITGNTLIITVTWADQRLHTPMYILLSSFSFCECCFISTVIPKLLSIFLLGQQRIHFTACLTQAFSFLFLGSTIFFLLAVMSLDQYLAICKPLHYPAIMNLRVCLLLVFCCCTVSFLFITALVLKVSQLSFCGSNLIPHFFCDLGSLINLSCSDTKAVEIYTFFLALCVIVLSLIVTIIAYSNIVVTIVRLPSARERQKAFSTCSSHLIVLSLMYGSCLFIYVKPKQTSRVDFNRQAALVNTVLTPVLNPVIYTLRNKQVHQALRGAVCKVRLQK
nr:olfactory receptor 6C75 [Oryctolagus cuniculus]